MVKTGQAAGHVRQLAYTPARGDGAPIELLSFADLRRIDTQGRRCEPQRPRFNVLAIVRSGHGRHSVDFTEGPLAPGSLVWVRPGQVNQWLEVDTITGDLVLFTPTAVAFTAATPVCWQLDGSSWALTLAGVDHLRSEAAADPTSPILNDLLTALLRRSVMDLGEHGAPPGGLAQQFYAAVEHHLAQGHRLSTARYASELNYAPRTLNRAVVVAAGITAKTWLDQRTVLEAQRLLVHGGLSAAACARQLGFDDAANFSAFFIRCTGMAPGRWRHHAGPPAARFPDE
jgi:AraC family transcriptional activator of pobA